MTYGHAGLIASLGRCADDPTCTRIAIVQDDTDPTVRRCGQHAIAHLTDQETPVTDDAPTTEPEDREARPLGWLFRNNAAPTTRTGAEHYLESERLMGAVGGARALLLDDGVPLAAPDLIAAAQVHATLALAAATGAGHAKPGEYGRPVPARVPTAVELIDGAR